MLIIHKIVNSEYMFLYRERMLCT